MEPTDCQGTSADKGAINILGVCKDISLRFPGVQKEYKITPLVVKNLQSLVNLETFFFTKYGILPFNPNNEDCRKIMNPTVQENSVTRWTTTYTSKYRQGIHKCHRTQVHQQSRRNKATSNSNYKIANICHTLPPYTQAQNPQVQVTMRNMYSIREGLKKSKSMVGHHTP